MPSAYDNTALQPPQNSSGIMRKPRARRAAHPSAHVVAGRQKKMRRLSEISATSPALSPSDDSLPPVRIEADVITA
jgi:hypothetical protein